MLELNVSLFLYVPVALFVAWIWVDYFRLIDIYDKKNLWVVLLTFGLGFVLAPVVFPINNYILDYTHLELGGGAIMDFVFCVVRIGMLEELLKIIPLFLMIWRFPRQFNEPIDYLAFAAFSALGFSAIENISYMQSYDFAVVTKRSISSTLAHMFCSAIVAYGIVLVKFRNRKVNPIIAVLGFFILAALSHGFYDFWLIHEGTQRGGFLVTFIYFLLTISIFAVMLNNAMNNSGFFSYKRIVNSGKVTNRMLLYYAMLMVVNFVVVTVEEEWWIALFSLVWFMATYGMVIVITVLRLSRFKLIQGRWNRIPIQIPFRINYTETYEGSNFNIQVRGEGYDETLINQYYNEYFQLSPISKRSKFLQKPTMAYIEKKIFLNNDDAYYLARVYKSIESAESYRFVLKPKTKGTTSYNDKTPIAALLEFDAKHNLTDSSLDKGDFKFKEWVVLRPLKKKPTSDNMLS